MNSNEKSTKKGGDKMGKDAYDRGRDDGRNGNSENPYIPGEESRQDYQEGNADGAGEKSEAEAND